ncbi:nestin [Electrophorus electricus]|uniref:IF rod domain-containing protein n=1 Tax=Electrophorus electricus TaxID=8005 RepID=A0AAY5ER67_ELEEL|nr:nestin [Electrophorus electricus]
MATSSVRQPLLHAGEERFQMLELNRRLESYLGHVKLLEEENQLLWGEIQALRRSQDTGGRRQVQEEAVRLARREIQTAWLEKDHAELEVGKLLEEIEELNAQRQGVREAQAEAKRRLKQSRGELEDEKRAHIWLREQAAHLEKELSVQVHVHQEDVAALKSSYALWKPAPAVPHETQAIRLQGLGEEYSQQAARAWQEAADVYQRKVAQLEENLDQTKAHMAHITQEKRERQLQVQDLAKELMGMEGKRELLEKNVVHLRDRQNQELQHLQTQVQTLEAEKGGLGEQLGELLEDRRNLLQMKTSLGLEVATYRALLDAESLRVGQSAKRTSTRTDSLSDALTKPRGTHLGAQGISASCQFSTLLTTASRSMTHSKAQRMSATPAWSLPRITPQETLERAHTTVEENGYVSREAMKLEGSSAAVPPTGSSLLFDLEDANKKVGYAASGLAEPASPAADEPESMLGAPVRENMQEVLPESRAEATEVMSSSEEAVFLSSLPGHVSSPVQTPETEVFPNSNTENSKCLEDGEEEETEVSTEMARISYAPTFTGEEHDAMGPEEKDAASETELESESISEHNMQELRTDTASSGFKQHDESTSETASPLFEQTTWHATDTFNHIQKSSEISTGVDEEEIVSNFNTVESLKGAYEIKEVSTDEWEERERSDTDERTEVASSGPEVWDARDAVTATHVEEKRTDRWAGMERREGTEEQTEVTFSGPEVWGTCDAGTAVQDEMNNTECEAGERNVEEHVPAGDEENETAEEGVTDEHTGRDAMMQDSFGPEIGPHRSVECTEETAKSGVEPHDKDHGVAEDNAGEEQRESDDEVSFNVCASWTTDPGEADSYTQENTLADTRPLIHYRSDEETDANTQASHMGVSEPSDSEEERERHEGVGHWSQNASKRFDTMEDLSEEPEIDNPDDTFPDRSIQAVTEGPELLSRSIDGTTHDEPVTLEAEGLESESGDVDRHDNAPTDDALVDHSESNLQNISEERNNCGEKIEEENSHVLLVEKQKENANEYGLSESFSSESWEISEQKNISAKQPNSSEYGISIPNDNKENCNTESVAQIESDGEDVMKTNIEGLDLVTDTPLPCGEQIEEENSHVLLAEKQKESANEYGLSESFSSESWEISEQKNISAKQPNSSEYGISIPNDNKENCNTESVAQIESDGEDVMKTNIEGLDLVTDTPLPCGEQIEEENSHVLLAEKQKESANEYGLSESFSSESWEISEQKNISAKQPNSSEYGISIPNDNKENCNTESVAQIESDGEDVMKTNIEGLDLVTDTPLPCGEQIEEENSHVLLVEKQKESTHEYGLNESFSSESWEINEQKNISAKQPNSSEYGISITNDKENCNTESFSQIESEGENVMKPNFEGLDLVTDTPLLETFQEQAQAEEPSEMSLQKPTHLDVFPSEIAMTKEQPCPKEENDEMSNLPMLTHADLPDDLSLHSELSSQPDKQTNIAVSDLEESNSSGDESPNSSQCSQYLIQARVSAEQPVTGLLEEMISEGVGENSSGDCIAPQTEQQENKGSRNKEDQEDAVENSSSGMVENHSSLFELKEQQDLKQSDERIGGSHATVEKVGEMPTLDDKASDMMDIFQGKFLSEKSLTKEKDNDPHSFFTSGFKEGAWSTMEFETAATNVLAEPERFSRDTNHPNQSMVFEEDWGDVGMGNGKPEREMGIFLTQSDGKKEREEEQRIPKTKQIQSTDGEEGEVLAVQSDVSTDDGDSWSSGEE